MSAFVSEYGLGGFDHVADGRGDLWRGFGVAAQPSYVFVDDDGTLFRQIGALSDEELSAALARLAQS